VSAGLLLTAGFTTAPAQAALTSATKASPDSAIPYTLKNCVTGANNTVEYYGWCDGTGPTSYRVIAYCTNGEAVFGLERWDGDRRQSYASCAISTVKSTLNEDWGYLLCSNDNGDGTYQGYVNRHGDLSWMLFNWGNGNIMTGGTTMCDWDTNAEVAFNPNAAP
jgi:hypothetical protein